jgi:coenzyme F420 hydrogenase subunit beta
MNVPASATLRRVVAGQLCTGCGLCAGVSLGAVTMETLPPGYARPVQHRPLPDAAERAIAEACPGAVIAPWPTEAFVDPSWGPYRRVCVGWASDPDLRFTASSGGALSALLVHALRSGLTDRVIHVGADPDQPMRNQVLVSTSEAQVIAGAGSRYASSSPLADIETQLSSGGRFVFVGKPCDVSALRRLAALDRQVARSVAFTLSFFCAGVSSYAAGSRILARLGVEADDVAAFRYRGHGWPGAATATLQTGQTAELSYEESWGAILSKEVQFRCKICPDAVGGVADIACGDAWIGADARGYPSFAEADGRSLVIIRTAAGERLAEAAVAAGALVLEPLDVDEIDRMQPGQARRKRLVRSRTLALAATLQPRPRMGGTCVDEAAGRAGKAEAARSFLGAVRRILTGAR